METEKLYYQDPYLTAFTARVLSCEKSKSGWAVVLDRTAFYPEGGGQPADHGTLGAVQVTDVHETKGVIFHTCDGPVEIGTQVAGAVDWPRRFDHMQQHSGEHILSGLLCSLYHCDNVGFHLGADTVTIDYNAELTWEQVMAAEKAANEVIWQDTPVDITFPAPDALAAAMALVDSAELSVDTEASAASLARAGMEVDLGAVAKGFAAREAEAAIRDAGGTSAMLDLGGNVTVIGAKEDGSPWRVAVKDPRDTGSYLCVLALTDVTLSTSGGYERYFEEDGVRYHHIIDPETGYPADSGLLSVTVVSADHLLADALSTALFVAGPEEALDFWRSRDDFELVLCTGQGELLVTEGLEDVFTFAGADRGYTYEIARR